MDDPFGLALTEADLEFVGALEEGLDSGQVAEGLGGRRFGPQEIDALQIGAVDSGPPTVVRPDGSPVTICGRKALPQGCMPGGLCVVSVSVRPLADAVTPVPAADWQQRLLAVLSWQTGASGGDADVDLTLGSVFSVAGPHAISVVARIVAVDDDFAAPANPGPALECEVSLQWNASGNTKPARMSGPRVLLVGGAGPTVPRPIPPRAESMLVLTDTFAAAAGLVLELQWSPVVGGLVQSQTVNPLLNGTPVTGGAGFYTLAAAAGQAVVPIWDLSL